MRIDLRSDTVTRPTPGMKEAMFSAAVGDDVFGEDPTINALQDKIAAIFGMEAALFCTSGTQTNQIAIKTHTRPGDEVILDRYSHVYYYEGGGIASNSGASVCLLEGDKGRITASQVLDHINDASDVHRPLTRLVEVENTMNKGGGSIYDFKELEKIGQVCRDRGLLYHLDGARLFNALVETREDPKDYGKLFNSISICLSKGLGAPVGSLLLGSKEFIKRAHRIRKVLGGGMRQAGFLAAAGIYALDHHIKRLKEDNNRAKEIGKELEGLSYIENVVPVESNMVFFTLSKSFLGNQFLAKLKANDILALSLSQQTIRFVTHLDFTEEMMHKLIKILKSY